MKKLIAGITTTALIASLSAPAFAANFGDVSGTKYESAAGLLKALGVVNGEVNGNFNPNDQLTRAQFAKIAVQLAGFGAAADTYGTSANTGFSDVAAGHWASGYIAVAKSAGLVQGNGDGTFGPEENVTYEQVAAVFERILGYSDKLPGGWPNAYVLKAAQLGLTTNTGFGVGKSATRGDVALIAKAVLDQNTVAYSKDTDTFLYVKDANGNNINLLSKNYSTAVKDYVLTDTEFTQGTSLKAGEINLGTVNKDVYGNVTGVTNVTKFTLAAGASVVGSEAALVGHEVKAVLDSNGNVIYLADGKNTVASGALGATGNVSQNFTFSGDTTATTVGSNAVFYYNGQAVAKLASNFTTLFGSVSTSATVTVVKDATGVAVAVFVDKWDVSHALVDSVQVGTTTTTLSYKVYTGPTAFTITNITIPSTATVTRNGQTVAASALVKGDAVFVNALTSDSTQAAVVSAYSNTVTGNLDKTYVGNDAVKVTVNGTDYLVDSTMVDVTQYTSGNQVTLLLDGKNKVKQITNVTGATNEIVGYLSNVTQNVLKANSDGTYANVTRYTFFTTDGQTLTKDQPVADYTYNGGTTHALVKDDFYDVTFDSKGNVTTKATETATTGSAVGPVSNTNKTITVGTTVYQVTSSTVFVDATKTDSNGNVVGALTSLDKIATGGSVKVVSSNGVTASYVIVKAFGTASSNALAPVNGIVSNVFTTRTGSDSVTTVVMNVNGATQSVALAKNVSFSANEGDLARLVDNSLNGSYSVATDVYSDVYKATVTAPNDTNKTFSDGTNTYYVDSNTVVYIVKASDSSNAVSIGNYYDVKAASTVWVSKGVTYSTGNIHADAIMIRK